MSVKLMDRGGRYATLDMSNDTWFTPLSIPGVETLFSTRKTNDSIDCTRSKTHKLADLIEAWEPPGRWFSGIDKPEGKTLLIALLRNCKGLRIC